MTKCRKVGRLAVEYLGFEGWSWGVTGGRHSMERCDRVRFDLGCSDPVGCRS